jgi:TRAP-type C4-dicarboxylate transport system permease small subunit
MDCKEVAMEKIKKVMDKTLAAFIVALFAALVVIVFWQVFSRYVLKASSAFSEEMAKILFVWVSLLAAAFIFGEKGHMNIAVVVEKMPLKAKLVCQIFAGIINMIFIVFVLFFGGFLAVKLGWSQTNASIPIFTSGFIYAALPVSGAFSIFYETYNIYNDAKGLFVSKKDN